MKKFIYLFVVLCFSTNLFSQSFAINTDGSIANTSALLDIKSTAKGILIPRLSKTEKNSIATPAIGLLIFQNAPDSIGFQYYDGAKWLWILGSNNIDTLAWKTNGNANATSKFIGTTDNQPLRFKINNKWAGQIDSASRNVSLGLNSGSSSGIANISIGNASLKTVNIGLNNIAIGDSALPSNFIGSKNIGIGSNALYKISNANSTIGIGTATLGNNTFPSGAIAIGDSAGYNTFGSESVIIGFKAARSFTSSDGYHAVVIGPYAGDSSVANWSTVIGNLAGRVNKTIGNTFVGSSAGEKTTTGNVTAIGDNTALNNTTGYLTAIGTKALHFNTTGTNNTALGYLTSYFNTTGSRNTAVGDFTSFSNITGSNNTAIGTFALFLNTHGGGNTGIGNGALQNNTTGDNNTAVGSGALISHKNGFDNSAYGHNSLALDTSGRLNTASGYASLQSNLSGSSNSAFGFSALFTNTTGNYNTAIGSFADVGTNNLFNATAIGAYAQVDVSNAMVLGSINGVNGATANTKVGIGTTSPTTAKLVISGTAGTEGIDLASTDQYANMRVIRNSLNPSDKDMYIGYQSGANSTLHLYSNNGETVTVLGGNVGVNTPSPSVSLDVEGGIRTKYSGTLVLTPATTGLQTINLTISALPSGWNFANTVVLVSIVDGNYGIIEQIKLTSSTNIQILENVISAGIARYNYIVFKM